jgi:hypothetical protein
MQGTETFRPHVSVDEMTDYFREHDLRRAMVTRADGTFIGLLDPVDLESG